MKNNPLISVIVPVYKVERYLKNCVESILHQTYPNWELILVDDGSPDGCPAICDDYAAKDERITVVHQKNGGLSSARNAGLEKMKGEYVTFLDSDDFWHREFLERTVRLAEERESELVVCQLHRGSETVFPELNVPEEIKEYTNRSVFTSCAASIVMCGKLYSSHLFDGIRMPVGKINEDDFTAWKLYFRASRIIVTNQAYYYYTVNPNSIMGVQKKAPRLDFLEAYDERIRFFSERKDEDMLVMSRLQFCKALFLTLENRNLTEEQRCIVSGLLEENWPRIMHSGFVPLKFKIIFRMYSLVPGMTLQLVEKLYR